MISINRIKEHSDLVSLSINKYDAIFYGDNIDDRTNFIIKDIESLDHASTFHVKYDSESFEMRFNTEHCFSPMHLRNFFKDKRFNSIFIDATSLDFPELIYIFFAIKSADIKCSISVSYLEPNDYKRSLESSSSRKAGIQEQEFILSEKKGNFAYLPLFAINSSQTEKATLITTLGFESSRLGQLLEQDDGFAYDSIEAFVGLPAYKPGWENRSIYKHMRHLSPERAELKLYPACNPYEFLKQLEKLPDCYKNQPVVFAPMGTKPAVIAISLALVNGKHKEGTNFKFGALYDFPKKSKNRSYGVGKIFSYELLAS